MNLTNKLTIIGLLFLKACLDTNLWASNDSQTCLSVNLSLDKTTYHLNEALSFRVFVENCGSQSIYVERYFILAPGGNLRLRVRDATGRVASRHRSSIADAVLPFDEAGRLPVVLLKPGYSFGSTQRVAIAEYVTKPGKYTFSVRFISQLSEAATESRPIWDVSRPPLSSNYRTITVTD